LQRATAPDLARVITLRLKSIAPQVSPRRLDLCMAEVRHHDEWPVSAGAFAISAPTSAGDEQLTIRAWKKSGGHRLG